MAISSERNGEGEREGRKERTDQHKHINIEWRNREGTTKEQASTTLLQKQKAQKSLDKRKQEYTDSWTKQTAFLTRGLFLDSSETSSSSFMSSSASSSAPAVLCSLFGAVSLDCSSACVFSASLLCASRFSARFFSLTLALVARRLARDSSIGSGTGPLRFLYKQKQTNKPQTIKKNTYNG